MYFLSISLHVLVCLIWSILMQPAPALLLTLPFPVRGLAGETGRCSVCTPALSTLGWDCSCPGPTPACRERTKRIIWKEFRKLGRNECDALSLSCFLSYTHTHTHTHIHNHPIGGHSNAWGFLTTLPSFTTPTSCWRSRVRTFQRSMERPWTGERSLSNNTTQHSCGFPVCVSVCVCVTVCVSVCVCVTVCVCVCVCVCVWEWVCEREREREGEWERERETKRQTERGERVCVCPFSKSHWCHWTKAMVKQWHVSPNTHTRTRTHTHTHTQI